MCYQAQLFLLPSEENKTGSCVYLNLKGDRKVPGDSGTSGVPFIPAVLLEDLEVASRAVSLHIAQRSQMALTCAK